MRDERPVLGVEPGCDTIHSSLLLKETVKGLKSAKGTKKLGHSECEMIELEALESFKSGNKTL